MTSSDKPPQVRSFFSHSQKEKDYFFSCGCRGEGNKCLFISAICSKMSSSISLKLWPALLLHCTLFPTGLQEDYLSIPFLLQLLSILKWELERSRTSHRMQNCPFSISEIWSDMHSMVDPENSLSYSQHRASAEKWMNDGLDVLSPVYWLMADKCRSFWKMKVWG